MHHDTQLQRLADETGRRHKAIEALKRWRWFALFVILPSLLATLYFGLIASDIYVSESRFVIKSPDHRRAPISSLASLMQTTGLSGGQEQTNEIIGYLRSRDALRDLAKRTDVEGAFASPNADRLSRYPQIFHGNSFENLYAYYGSMVSASLDHETGVAVLQVNAFDPAQAQVLNEQLLRLSEVLVNRLNERANTKTIKEAENLVMVAEDRVRNARLALSRYRNSSELLDPQQQGAGVLGISNHLVSETVALRARLAAMEQAAPKHPSIPALRQRIAALSEQAAAQNSRAVGTPTGIASKLTGYEALMVEQEFATQMLTTANATLEQARAEALKQQYYLERIVQPNKPDDALLPARFKQIMAVVFALLCLYLIGWMLVIGILEHAPED